jgi:hypothetical protein
MKLFVGIGFIGTLLIGCAREDNSGYTTGSAPATEQGSATNVSEIPNTAGTSTRLNSIVATNAGPETGVGAGAAASSGIGTATASGAAAVETEAAATKDQNQLSTPPSPVGTGAQNPTINSNPAGNPATPPNNGSNQ